MKRKPKLDGCLLILIAVPSILNILDDELIKGVGNCILSCQNYEGGIAGEPGSEAHGGYTFCGLAAMILINEDRVVFRQGVECGFQGRTNKLVDGCYSFWQGGVFALLKGLHSVNGEHVAFSDAEEGDSATDGTSEGEDGNSLGTDETCHIKRGVGDGEMAPLFHSVALQQYIILCPQLLVFHYLFQPSHIHCWISTATSTPANIMITPGDSRIIRMAALQLANHYHATVYGTEGRIQR
ncbi:protein farnesyltransferase subunit beta-like isoform X2 [Manihot esculenta]|uniref:protein farnesyltransferase subunit beta-like isoform X2 n=1 Tax=Manihot esculenta TaxID=3983 RepID=UPI001CC61350|nr:protein farnesyltransferase subunit beta-like isoform X2 [Manihot esculenta]